MCVLSIKVAMQKRLETYLMGLVYPLNGYRELNSFEEPCFTLVATIISLAIYIYIYIYIFGGVLRAENRIGDPSFNHDEAVCVLLRVNTLCLLWGRSLALYLWSDGDSSVWVSMGMCTYVCVCMCVCAYMIGYVCAWVCSYAGIHEYVIVSVYLCVYACVYECPCVYVMNSFMLVSVC